MTERLSAGEACPRCSRRRLLRDGVGLTATALAVGGIVLPLTAKAASGAPQPAPGQDTQLPDPLPTPIPELDRFGHHNVPAAPYSEPSQIFDFNGRVAAAVLAGTGRDQNGNLVKFGGPGTDLRFMQGEYVTADGAHHHGTFLRI